MDELQAKYWWCPSCSLKVSLTHTQEWSRQCPTCGGVVTFVVPKAKRWENVVTDMPGIWRYYDFLPLFSKEHIVKSTEEVIYPLESRRLSEALHVRRVYLLPHSLNPTGTFKDLEAAFLVSKCQEWGINHLCVQSTGNTARSYRHYALLANLYITCFYPLEFAYKWQGVVRDPRGLLFGYDGPFQHISRVAKAYAQKRGLTYMAPYDWKLEGKTTMAYQIAEKLPSATLVVQTIAGGFGILAMNRGFERASQAGLFNRPRPRFGLFQIDGTDTIARVFHAYPDKNITETDLCLPKKPFEPTLQSSNPLFTYSPLRKIIVETGSLIRSVQTHIVEQYAPIFEQVCHELSIPISYQREKSPFISWAGLMECANQGQLSPDEEIVVVVTGASETQGAIPEPDKVIHSVDDVLHLT